MTEGQAAGAFTLRGTEAECRKRENRGAEELGTGEGCIPPQPTTGSGGAS